jgi:hypothetical protein
MLGSVSGSDGALREAWLRIRDQDPGAVDNTQGSLDDGRRSGVSEHAAHARSATRGAFGALPGSGGQLRNLARQRRVVDASFAASRDGNFDALLEVLALGGRHATTLIYLQAAPDLNPPREEPASGRPSAAFGPRTAVHTSRRASFARRGGLRDVIAGGYVARWAPPA